MPRRLLLSLRETKINNDIILSYRAIYSLRSRLTITHPGSRVFPVDRIFARNGKRTRLGVLGRQNRHFGMCWCPVHPISSHPEKTPWEHHSSHVSLQSSPPPF